MSADNESRLQRIYELHGTDRSKWGYRVIAKFRCRIRNANGLLASQLSADLQNGVKVCPIDSNSEEVVTPHPAFNVAGVVAATDFPDECQLCKLKPQSHDFDIR